MKLWRRAAGALKDKNSIWIAKLSSKNSYSNPALHKAIIKATSHNKDFLDYKNAQRAISWINISSMHVKSFFIALSQRMQKTHCWVVALKGLILLHGIFTCDVPAAQRIGRLPFDFSKFNDRDVGVWQFNVFIRRYYSFLDQKSVYMTKDAQERSQIGVVYQETLSMEILKLQRLQKLLDYMLQIRTREDAMREFLILEAMECIIIEIFDVYSKICGGIARVLMKIYSAQKIEAAMTLDVLVKAKEQSKRLQHYFELCRKIGVMNASSVPKVEQIPEEDIEEIQRFIYGAPEKDVECVVQDQDKNAIVVVDESSPAVAECKEPKGPLWTIITDKWETFDEDFKVHGETKFACEAEKEVSHLFSQDCKPHLAIQNHNDVPDLITF